MLRLRSEANTAARSAALILPRELSGVSVTVELGVCIFCRVFWLEGFS